jgi:3-methyladenine DNA glycosylase AlkD
VPVTSAAFDAEAAASKAIGWVLRETAKKDPAYVAAWTRSHVNQMSGVTFTEAVRRLPAGQAAELRAVYSKPAGS